MRTRGYLRLGGAALLLLTATSVTAGQITSLQLFDGGSAPTATINYTNPDGSGSNTASVYADPVVSGNLNAPVYYCVDLWHENDIGQTYTISSVAGIAFPNSTFSDVDNRIGWLLTQDQSTPDARAAVQLAIWYTVDNNNNGFSMSSGDGTITSDYNALISFAGYDSSLTYSANFWQATHDPTNSLYQDLVSAGSNFGEQSVPEPSSNFLLSLGSLFFVGLYWWRRVY